MCSRDVKTTLPSATIPSLRIASRITANACLRYELINLDDAFAVDGDGLELLWFKLDILALGDLVAFNDVATIHLITGFGVDFPVAEAIAGLFIELMEADLFSLGSRRKQRDGARDERELEVAFPIRARGHESLLTLLGTGIVRSVPQSTATENSFHGFCSQPVLVSMGDSYHVTSDPRA
jgi:hypothetical protein